jgi:hypothetical protein
MKLSLEWKNALHEPEGGRTDWRLFLPFYPSIANAFSSMCDTGNIPLKEREDGRVYTYISELGNSLEKTRCWLGLIGDCVVVRDCLALSFALDYDRGEGNPDKPQTKVGALRSRAKTYDKVSTVDTYRAADELVKECLDFLGQMPCYSTATCVAGMPPSRPDKPFDLPAYLAVKIAAGLGIPDLTHAVSTIKERPQLKGELLDKKLPSIEGTVSVDSHALKDQIVLLIDDIYQSGVSTNYVAMLMLEAGAKKVFGLACEKTCRNDDNIPRSAEK